jgi:hypothetical protein
VPSFLRNSQGMSNLVSSIASRYEGAHSHGEVDRQPMSQALEPIPLLDRRSLSNFPEVPGSGHTSLRLHSHEEV